MIIIIGGGPAGISAARYLERKGISYILLESSTHLGGLCKSFSLNDVTFDLGGHAFFTKEKEIERLFAEELGISLYAQPRKAWVYAFEKLVPYPFQANLYGLPKKIINDCLKGLEIVQSNEYPRKTDSLESWIMTNFGPGIAEHFLFPYNKKVWAYPLSEIQPSWTSERIVTPDLLKIYEGAHKRLDFNNFPNSIVRYPKNGGYEELIKALAKSINIKNVRLNERVTKIDSSKKILYSNECEYHYEALLSTMPLDSLIGILNAPLNILEISNKLKHNSLHLVSMVVENFSSDIQRLYCANNDVPFHKLVFNSNSSESLRLKRGFALQAEISSSPHKPVEIAGIESRVINSLKDLNILKPEHTISNIDYRFIKKAYPIYTKHTAEVRIRLMNFLNKQNIWCAGRFGEWLYINIDKAIKRGIDTAKNIEKSS